MESLIFYFIIFIIYMVLVSREKFKKAQNSRHIQRQDPVEADSPESFLGKVKHIIEDEFMAEELREEIKKYRSKKTDPDANANHGHPHLQPEVTRDDTIMREQLKEFRHSESVGLDRLNREDLHRPFDLSDQKGTLSDQYQKNDLDLSQEQDDSLEDGLNLFGDQDEVLKALIYSEILDKPKSLR